MDIPCTKCGEPWDNDSIHQYAEDTDSTYTKVARAFGAEGCGAFAEWGISPCEADDKASIRGALWEMMGDDVDGYASDMDDFQYMGLL